MAIWVFLKIHAIAQAKKLQSEKEEDSNKIRTSEKVINRCVVR